MYKSTAPVQAVNELSPSLGRRQLRGITESAVLEGNALAVLRSLPSDSVRCAITSPPYWGLRDYGIQGQIGLEPSLSQFLDQLTLVFSELRRVLANDGTLWLNIGDGYTSGNRGYRASDKKNPARAMATRPPTPDGLKPKDLIGVPWRLAFALQEDGWFLRSDVVWNKPNAMPDTMASTSCLLLYAHGQLAGTRKGASHPPAGTAERVR